MYNSDKSLYFDKLLLGSVKSIMKSMKTERMVRFEKKVTE